MDKTKILTQEDIDLLFSENWLTTSQQDHYNIYINESFSYSQIQIFCPDLIILDFIFNPKPLEIIEIQYTVNLYHYGESVGKAFVFNNITGAINCKEKMSKQNNNPNYEIRVNYKIKGK